MSAKFTMRFVSVIAFCLLTGCAANQTQPTTLSPADAEFTITPTMKVSKTTLPTRGTNTPAQKPGLYIDENDPTIELTTPTPSPSSYLEIKEPSLKVLDDYLQKQVTNFYGWESNTLFSSEDVTGDGKPDTVGRDPYVGRIYVTVAYADINGDKEDDIIASEISGLTILIWDGDHYAEPYRLETGTWSRGDITPNKVIIQDWTDDGVPEIVLDNRFVSGGTGLLEYYTDRYIIRCIDIKCEKVWEANVGYHADDYNSGGLEHYEMELRPSTDKDGAPVIRAVDDGFYIYCCAFWEMQNPESLNYLPSNLSVYTWDGKSFELTDQQVISLASKVDSHPILAARSATGIDAKVIAKNNYAAGNDNDYCQLIINGEIAGDKFGCRQNFTTIEWKDITSDSLEEVVIITYSAGYPLGLYEDNSGYLSDEECMHQRIIVYQSDGINNVEIANTAGCVIQKDLYGVRLEDYDGDGVPEIFAAPNVQDYDKDGIPEVTEGPKIQLKNRMYKWNGKRFVYWSDIPLLGE